MCLLVDGRRNVLGGCVTPEKEKTGKNNGKQHPLRVLEVLWIFHRLLGGFISEKETQGMVVGRKAQ